MRKTSLDCQTNYPLKCKKCLQKKVEIIGLDIGGLKANRIFLKKSTVTTYRLSAYLRTALIREHCFL